MQLFSLAIAFLTGCVGIYLGFRAYKNFEYLTRDEIFFKHLVFNSIVAGGAGTLIFFSITMVMAFFDITYVWSIDKLLGAMVLPLIIGGVITIGSFVQAIMIARYRRILLDALRSKGKRK